MSFKKKILILFFSLVCLTLLILGASLYYILSNIDRFSDFFSQKIEAEVHRKVSIGSVNVSFWGGLGIEVKEFTIKDEKAEQNLFTAGNLTFGLKLFPLFIRQVVFDKVLLDNLKIIIVRDREGNANSLKEIYSLMERGRETENVFKSLLTPSFSVSQAIIRKGEIEFIDYSLPPYPLITRIEGVAMKCKRSVRRGKGINFILTCNIMSSNQKSSLKIEGKMDKFPENWDFSHLILDTRIEINQLPLSHFWPYYQRYLPFKNATALLDLELTYRGNPFHKFHSNGSIRMREINFVYPRAFSHTLTPKQVELSYQLDMDGESLTINEGTLRLDDCDFKGSFLLSGIKSKDLKVAAKLKSNRFLWSSFKGYLPLQIMSPALGRFWMNCMEEGWVEIESASCNGRIRDFAKIKLPEYSHLIKGKAKVSQFNLNLLEGFIPLKELQGTAFLERGNLLLQDFSGTLRGSHLSRMEGTISHLYSQSVLNVKAEGDLKMPHILSMLLHEKMPSRMRPLLKDITAMGGQAQLNLAISGIRLSGQYVPPLFDGSLTLNKLSISYRKLPFLLSDLQGIVRFSHQLLMSKEITGKWGVSPFSLKGKVMEWQELNPYLDLLLLSDINLPELKTFFPKGFFAVIDAQGMGYLKGNLKGYFNKMRFSGDLDLDKGSYQLYEWLLKPKRMNNKLQFSGLFLNKENEIQLDSLRYSLKSSEIRSKGKLQFNQKHMFSFSIMTKGINLAELEYINLTGLKPMGIIQGEAVIKGEIENWGNMEINGVLNCDRVGLKPKLAALPIFTLSTAIKFNERSVQLNSFIFNTGDTSFTLKGDMNGYASPRIHLNASSPFLGLDDLISLKSKIGIEEEKKGKGKRDWLERISLEGEVSVAQGKYQDFTFSYLKGQSNMRNGILEFKNLEFLSGEGRVISDLMFDLKQREYTLIGLDSGIEEMDVKRVVRLLSFKGNSLTGTLDCEGDLKSQFEEINELPKRLNGDIKLRLSQGRIQGFTILSKILSILNLSQIFKLRFDELIMKGMPYKSITGTLRIKKGIISTEDLFLDGDQMRISAVGKINLTKGELNLNLGVQPLVTVDKILNNIPVVGKIITGKDKSLVVSYFKVEGKISDPEVKVIPLKSLTQGVSDILEQILNVPQQLLDVPQKILKPSQ